MNSSEIDILINEISKLPGIGRRSAQRIAIYLLKNKNAALSPLIRILSDAKTNIAGIDHINITTIRTFTY